jgi:hypothetical protein
MSPIAIFAIDLNYTEFPKISTGSISEVYRLRNVCT